MDERQPESGKPASESLLGTHRQVDAQEIREVIERIRSSQTFDHSHRILEFLEFVVAATLRGDGPGLGESSIGVGLYHRGPDYDPNLDGIVRTQAKRLRERLSEYYASEGALDSVVIRMDVGYAPLFERRTTSTEGGNPAAGEAVGFWSAALAGLAIAGGIFAYFKIHSRPASPVRGRTVR